MSINRTMVEAAKAGDLDAVKRCVKGGADITFDDCSALRTATFEGHLDIIKYFVEDKGLDIHFRNEYVLNYAAERGHMDIVRYCIEEHGCSPNRGQESALNRACKHKNYELMTYLLENGADPSVMNIWDMNSMDVCLRLNDRIGAEILHKYIQFNKIAKRQPGRKPKADLTLDELRKTYDPQSYRLNIFNSPAPINGLAMMAWGGHFDEVMDRFHGELTPNDLGQCGLDQMELQDILRAKGQLNVLFDVKYYSPSDPTAPKRAEALFDALSDKNKAVAQAAYSKTMNILNISNRTKRQNPKLR